MGVIQRGFKSLVYRMNIEEQKKLLAMKRTTRGQLRDREGSWEGAGAKRRQPASDSDAGNAMGKPSDDEQNRSEAEIDYQYGSPQGERSESNLIRGRQSGKSWHNTAKSRHSALEVNEAFGWWRITFLPGEISEACGHSNAAAHRSAMADVIPEKSAEVIVKWSRTGRMKEA